MQQPVPRHLSGETFSIECRMQMEEYKAGFTTKIFYETTGLI